MQETCPTSSTWLAGYRATRMMIWMCVIPWGPQCRHLAHWATCGPTIVSHLQPSWGCADFACSRWQITVTIDLELRSLHLKRFAVCVPDIDTARSEAGWTDAPESRVTRRSQSGARLRRTVTRRGSEDERSRIHAKGGVAMTIWIRIRIVLFGLITDPGDLC